MSSVLVVDGANVVGSVPDGWWKDRAGAARRLHQRLLVADTPYDVLVLVLEGKAKGGVRAGRDAHVTTVHAARDGDSEIESQVTAARASGRSVTVITADRFLQSRVQGLGAMAMSPSWLLDKI
jgi:predicted RNA-binding protein with PIN domain